MTANPHLAAPHDDLPGVVQVAWLSSGDQGGRDLAVAAPSAHTKAETAPLGRWPILARAPVRMART
jgi:hypothetical protein